MRYPTEEEVRSLQERFPEGSRVELLEMRDPQAPPVGTRGTVTGVDDAGSIMVHWDNGSSLNVAYGADYCRPLVPEFTRTVREQILAIRDFGEVNMFLIPMVQRIAFEREYYELVLFLEEHRKEYAAFIMTGHV